MSYLATVALFLCLSAEGADRPNVLLICVDDLKPVLGCYGDPIAQTPNIDRLAKRSILFENAYCNQAVCSPSRNALLVGLRPQTLGIYDLATNFRNSRPDAITLPQYFKQNGYRTEGLGKIFHVGHGNHEDDRSWSVPHWRSNVVAYALPESKAKTGLTREEALFSNKAADGLPKGAAYESADVPDNTYPDGALADEAIQRLRSAKERAADPFFIAVGFVKPHLPFVAPKKYWDLYKRDQFAIANVQTPPQDAPTYAPQFGGELRNYKDIPASGTLNPELQTQLIHGYYAAMSYMDAQAGRVLDELEQLGLADKTIVVLWGDHGWHLGDHGMWCKHTNYEQAARIPLLISVPGITKESRSKAFVESVDIYPTLSELAGLSVPKEIDGVSFAGTVRDPNRPAREFVTHVYPRNANQRKLLGRAIRTDRYRLVEWKEFGASPESAEYELYDYVADPEETVNLATKEKEIVRQLRPKLEQQTEAVKQIKSNEPPRKKKKK